MSKYHIGIDPDLQTPALAVVSEDARVLLVACMKTSKSKQQQAVVEIASEGMLWIDSVAEELAFAGLSHQDAATITVEAQEVYRGKTANPQDLLVLAAAAGVSLAQAALRWPNAKLDFPLPKTWKKGVPKRIHQGRILSRLGIEYESRGEKGTGYCVPSWKENSPLGSDRVTDSAWKHIVDAIGLAAYGATKHEASQRTKKS